jgi:hypothetical protein
MHRRSQALRLCLCGVVVAGLATACSESKPPPDRAAPRGADAPSGFADRVWKVSESTSVAPGTLYVFQSDGKLLVTSPGSEPAVGSWKMENGALTMVEESLSYPTDILESGPKVLRLRSHNPGEPVEITLVPAETGG